MDEGRKKEVGRNIFEGVGSDDAGEHRDNPIPAALIFLKFGIQFGANLKIFFE